MRETYSYSTRFRKPVGVGNLNFESTALRPLIRSYVRNIEKKTARYEPPKGINKKRIGLSVFLKGRFTDILGFYPYAFTLFGFPANI